MITANCKLITANCKLITAEINLQFAVIDLQFAVIDLQFVVIDLQFAVIILQFAVIDLQNFGLKDTFQRPTKFERSFSSLHHPQYSGLFFTLPAKFIKTDLANSKFYSSVSVISMKGPKSQDSFAKIYSENYFSVKNFSSKVTEKMTKKIHIR